MIGRTIERLTNTDDKVIGRLTRCGLAVLAIGCCLVMIARAPLGVVGAVLVIAAILMLQALFFLRHHHRRQTVAMFYWFGMPLAGLLFFAARERGYDIIAAIAAGCVVVCVIGFFRARFGGLFLDQRGSRPPHGK